MIYFAVDLGCEVVGAGIRRNTDASSGVFMGACVGGDFVRVALSHAILASNDTQSAFMVVVRVSFFSLSERSSCSSWSILLNRSVVVVDISSMLLSAWSGGGVVILTWLSMVKFCS